MFVFSLGLVLMYMNVVNFNEIIFKKPTVNRERTCELKKNSFELINSGER